MLISEIYHSRQGEGRLAGTPSVFVRTSGCNLRCDFCDTPFTSWNPSGRKQTVREVVQQVVEASKNPLPNRVDGVIESQDFDVARHVVLTGGEPMLPVDVVQLCDQLKEANFHITIETAGTIHHHLHCDLMSISPKLSNSTPSHERAGQWASRHEDTRHRPDVVANLIQSHDYQLKFVVADEADIGEIESYLVAIQKHRSEVDRSKVLLMPEGIDAATLRSRKEWLEPLCKDAGFTLCDRKHILWYGNKRAT
jgi:7-carboxy-7-deazaguanine synthase